MGYVVIDSAGNTLNKGSVVWTDGARAYTLVEVVPGTTPRVKVRKGLYGPDSTFSAAFFGLTVTAK